jgi:hypothetical protein
MSNLLNEEINRLYFLFNYKPGKVISEQESEYEYELDEAGRPRKVNTRDEVNKIKDEIKNKVIQNNEIMFSDFESLLKKDKDFLNSLSPYYSKSFNVYKDVPPQGYDKLYNEIINKAKQQGDVPLQDINFVSKNFLNKLDDLKKLLTYDSPFENVSVDEKVLSIFNRANRTKELSNADRVYLTNHKPSVLQQLKPIVDKERGRKKYMTDDILLDKLIEIEDRVKTENDIRQRDYVYLKKNAPDVLEDLKPIWGKTTKVRRLSPEELETRYKEIEESCKRMNDIYFSDYTFLKYKNPELLEDLRVYWGKYTKKPKPVIPEPVIEPEPETDDVNITPGVRGRKPLTPEQINKRIEDIKTKFDETKRLESKDYQFLFKYDPELLKTMVRPKKQKAQTDVEVNPEETPYEPVGKLSDYWTSSSTGDYNYKYEN